MDCLRTRRAVAYVNWGRWVADCPMGCNNAELLQPGQDAYRCSNCMCMSVVQWPDDAAGIWHALDMRVMRSHRNWYPREHPVALMAGVPHGQSVDDLMCETLVHANDTE